MIKKLEELNKERHEVYEKCWDEWHKYLETYRSKLLELLPYEGKFIKTDLDFEGVYSYIKVDEIFKHGGDTIVIRGYGFYSEFTEYLDATYTSWGFMKEIHIKIDRISEEIKKIQIITKEEFNQAFDLMIENMKKDHLKEIS